MHNDGLGTFTYDISTEVIMHYQDYDQASNQYQLVAYNMERRGLLGPKVYENNLTLAALSVAQGGREFMKIATLVLEDGTVLEGQALARILMSCSSWCSTPA